MRCPCQSPRVQSHRGSRTWQPPPSCVAQAPASDGAPARGACVVSYSCETRFELWTLMRGCGTVQGKT